MSSLLSSRGGPIAIPTAEISRSRAGIEVANAFSGLALLEDASETTPPPLPRAHPNLHDAFEPKRQ